MSAPQLRSKQEKATDGDDEHERIDVKAAVKNMQDAGMPLRRIHELLGIEPAKAPEMKEREPKGDDHCRSAEGTFCYIDHLGKYVIRGKGGVKITRRACTPMNADSIVRNGIAAGTATEAVETQIVGDDAPPLTLLAPTVAPVARKPAPPPKVVKVVDAASVPVGALTQHFWYGKDKSHAGRFYDGEVVAITKDANGRVWHEIRYDGWSATTLHDLAHDQESGSCPWSLRPSAAAAPRPSKAAAPQPAPRTVGARTRLQSTMHAKLAAGIARVVDEEQHELFNQACNQLLGEKGDKYLATDQEGVFDKFDGLIEEWDGLQAGGDDVATGRVNKASQNVVDVETPIGVEKLKVPSSTREVMASPQRPHWLAADEKAVEVAILAFGGNEYYCIDDALREGEVEEGVMQRRIKTDGKRLATHDPYKSRLAIDGARRERRMAARGMVRRTPSFSTSPPPVLKKWFLAETTLRGYSLVKGDVGNAYPRAATKRGRRFLRLPLHLRKYDDQGREMVIAIDTPMWGEHEAGYEFDVDWHEKRLSVGFRPSPTVPGLWVGPHNLMMIGEVDDFLIAEPQEQQYKYSALALELLERCYRTPNDKKEVIKYEAEPSVYSGMEMAVSTDRLRRTLRCEQKIVEACREHVPVVIDGSEADVKAAGLLVGGPLRAAIDEMHLGDPDTAQTTEQKRFRQAAGSLTYICETAYRYEFARGRCSAVMSRVNPGAYKVAQSILADAYTHKREGITFSGTADTVARPRLDLAAPYVKRLDQGGDRDEGHGGPSGVTLAAGAPHKMEAHGDATYARMDKHNKPADLYGVVVTKAKAALYAKSKRITGVVPSSSTDNENVPTVKVTHMVEYLLEAETYVGNDTSEPVLVTTDNSGNQLVSEGESSAGRVRHILLRWMNIRARIAQGMIMVRHVKTAENPADWLTKWVSTAALEASLAYVTNSAEAVEDTDPAFKTAAERALADALARAKERVEAGQ